MATPKPKVTCEQIISACDKALAERDKEIDLSGQTIKGLQGQNATLIKNNDSLRGSMGAWYRNPFVTVILGVAVGGIGYSLLKK